MLHAIVAPASFSNEETDLWVRITSCRGRNFDTRDDLQLVRSVSRDGSQVALQQSLIFRPRIGPDSTRTFTCQVKPDHHRLLHLFSRRGLPVIANSNQLLTERGLGGPRAVAEPRSGRLSGQEGRLPRRTAQAPRSAMLSLWSAGFPTLSDFRFLGLGVRLGPSDLKRGPGGGSGLWRG